MVIFATWLSLVIAGCAQKSSPTRSDITETAIVPLFGVPIVGQRIVFIIEHNASMLDNLDLLKSALSESVATLHPEQKFNIIAYCAAGTTSILPEPQAATRKTKNSSIRKIAAIRGQGEPYYLNQQIRQALQKAFAMKPDAIYLVSYGFYDPELADFVNRLDTSRSVRLNTLALAYLEPAFIEQLSDLAESRQGIYHYVDFEKYLR